MNFFAPLSSLKTAFKTTCFSFFFFLLITLSLYAQPYIRTSGGLGQYGYIEKNATATNFLVANGGYGNIFQYGVRSYINNGTNNYAYTGSGSCARGDDATSNYTFGSGTLNTGSTVYSSVFTQYCGPFYSHGSMSPTGPCFNERSFFVMDFVPKTDALVSSACYTTTNSNVVMTFTIENNNTASQYLNRLWLVNDGTAQENTDINAVNDAFRIYYEPATGSEVFNGTESSMPLYGNYAGNSTSNNEYGSDALGIAIPQNTTGGLRCYIVLQGTSTYLNTSAKTKTIRMAVIQDGISITPNRDTSFSKMIMDLTRPSTSFITINDIVSPTFTAISPICNGDSFTLPTTSNNGIVGTWSPAINNSATTTYTFTPNFGQCGTTTTMTVTVNATSNGGSVSGGSSICSGSTSAVMSLTGNVGSVLRWESSVSPFATWSTISNTSNTYTSGVLTQTTQFRAVVQSGVCSSANSSATTVTVNPPSVGGTVAGGTTICSGSTSSELTLSDNVGTVLSWESSVSPFTSWNTISNTSNTFTSGALTQTTQFRAVVQSGVCSSANSSATTVTVNTPSVGGTVEGGSIVCAGTTSGELTLSGYTGAVVRWESSVDPYTSWTSIDITSSTYTSSPLTQTTQFRAVVQSGVCATANSASTSVTINYTTWNNGVWSNGAPDATVSAIISSSYTSNGTDLTACSLSVSNNISVVISSNNTVTLSGPLTVGTGALVTFNNNANLIQSGSSNLNTGAIILKRNSSALKRQDYTLWSSPVASQQLQLFSPQTLSNRFYTYNTDTNLYDVVSSTSTTNFQTAKGYLIRMPNNHPTTATVWGGQFTGVPNSGNYSYSLPSQDGGVGHRYVLVGNPYPSPIDINAFVNDSNNDTSITGTLYFWRKTNNELIPSYCTWTTTGFVTNNNLQSYDPNDVIQTGQGFFVESTGVGTTVDFKNNMRINNHSNQFFKNNSVIERNRVWLNATSSSGLFSQTMIGYVTNATQGVDPKIDGKYINDGDIALTSLIQNEPYAIQGRSLPFDASDVVPLQFKATTAGDYKIEVSHADGFFSQGQDVYLNDKLLNTIHNLSVSGYDFASDSGSFDNRFEIMYQMPLAISDPEFTPNQIIVYKNALNELVINSGSSTMKTIKILDLRGRIIDVKDNLNCSQIILKELLVANEVLVLQITNEEGIIVTKKIIR
jgi:hypothetical protein